MKRRFTVLAAVVGVLSLSGLFAGPAQAAVHQTREGLAIELTAAQQSVRKIAPLDSSLTSGEALVSSNVHAAVKNIGDKKVRATLELGYQVGYPVSVAPTGVKITAHTPELKLTSGVNAKFKPEANISGTGGGGEVGEVGASLGAEATVIPSADLEFEVGAGKITTVTLAEIALTKPVADIVLSGVNLNVTNALGPISVRPFAKISVSSESGVYVYYAYGATTRI
ncbi:porin MspA [Gordonia hirsuta DSM 44140 = NBRC 16056]|uniref:Porin MspA n=1 Tax=Gordonia hirsuta DSM 44140 = NBRC 16056 TaxID=1121927 RepID=L7LAK5_9ACTN|nr:MspA family porin [Gordonia hirsuta]GAC57944.1 porin MspA [Gordonia hirsuta DSM 44140 = NBRC 16056]